MTTEAEAAAEISADAPDAVTTEVPITDTPVQAETAAETAPENTES